jgi:hypothetical protein
MALFVQMIIIAVNMTLHNNIFRSNSYIILICVMCLWPGLVVDTRYMYLLSGFLIIISNNLMMLVTKALLSSNYSSSSDNLKKKPSEATVFFKLSLSQEWSSVRFIDNYKSRKHVR